MEIQEPGEHQSEGQGVAIYAKWAIVLFSIFFSPLVGGILLMLNLRSVGLKREGYNVLIFSIAWYFISSIIISSFFKVTDIHAVAKEVIGNTQLMIYSKVLDILGAAILAEYFFKKYFPDNNYERKSILKPLFIMLLIAIPLTMLMGGI